MTNSAPQLRIINPIHPYKPSAEMLDATMYLQHPVKRSLYKELENLKREVRE